jgi:hypothetical protein
MLQSVQDLVDLRSQEVRGREVRPESSGRGVLEAGDSVMGIRKRQMIDLGKIGILGSHPEEGETRDVQPGLYLLRDDHDGKGFVETVERATKESHLLSRDGDDRLGVPKALNAG